MTYSQVVFDYFNIMVTTLTVVGYGANMPSYTDNAGDTGLLIFVIIFGSMIFSVFSGQLHIMF